MVSESARRLSNSNVGVLRRAINEMCKSCIYDSHSEGTWRKQVENCTSPDCPLYPYRPLASDDSCAEIGGKTTQS